MSYVVLAAIGMLTVAVEAAAMPYVSLWGVKPDLLVVLVVLIALMYGSRRAAVTGLIVGLIQDILLGRGLGMFSFALMSTGFVTGLAEGKIYRDSPLMLAASAFAGSAAYQLFFALAYAGLGHRMPGFWQYLRMVLLFGLGNAIIAPFAYGPLLRLNVFERFSPKRESAGKEI